LLPGSLIQKNAHELILLKQWQVVHNTAKMYNFFVALPIEQLNLLVLDESGYVHGQSF